MSTWAQVGAKCVCVNAAPRNEPVFRRSMDGLSQAETYEIRWVGLISHPVVGQYLGLRLVGLHREYDVLSGIDDLPFTVGRFRPVVEQPDDVALFTHHLTDQPVDA